MHSAMNCINKSKILRNLSIDIKEKINTIATHRILYKKGTFIYQPGIDNSKLLMVDEGMVKIYVLSENGEENIVTLLGSGDIEGEKNLFKPLDNNYFVQALRDTWICQIPYDKFQFLLNDNPNLSNELINELGEKLVDSETLSAIMHLPSKERLKSYLIELSIKSGSDKFKLPISKRDLSNLLGITPETISRTFKQLMNENFLEMSKTEIKLILGK